MTSTCQDSFVV